MSYAIVRVEKKWFPDRRIYMDVITKVAGFGSSKGSADKTQKRLTDEIESDVIEYHRLLVKPQTPIYNEDEVDEGEELEHIGNQVLTAAEEKWMEKYQSSGIQQAVRYEIQPIGKW